MAAALGVVADAANTRLLQEVRSPYILRKALLLVWRFC